MIGASNIISSRQKYRLKNKTKSILFSIFRWCFLLAVGYIVLLPLFSMISYSFMPREQMFDPDVVWIPKSITFENIKTAWEKLDYINSASRSLFYEVGAGILQVFTTTLAGYSLARFKFKGKKIFIALLFMTAFIPTPMIITSLFCNFSKFDFLGILGLFKTLTNIDLRPDLLNSPAVFYLPALFSIGLNSGICIFIYMQFFKGLPQELEDAASVDGAGPIMTFLRIILPSSSVAITTVLIFSVIWHWNDYYLAVMYFNENFTLAVQLSQALQTVEMTLSVVMIQMAGCLLFVIPVLIFYLIFQRKFIQSIDRVGIVG